MIKIHFFRIRISYIIFIFAHLAYSKIDSSRIDGVYNIKLGMSVDSVIPKLKNPSIKYDGSYTRIFIPGNHLCDPEQQPNYFYFYKNKLYEFSFHPTLISPDDYDKHFAKMVKYFGHFTTRSKSIDSLASAKMGIGGLYANLIIYEWKDTLLNTGAILLVPESNGCSFRFPIKVIFLDYNSKAIRDESMYNFR